MSLVPPRKKPAKPTEKAVLKLLDAAAKKYGIPDVRKAANKWANGQRVKAALIRKRAALEKQLAEVSQKIKP